jgi:hypothetical protein
VIENAQDYNKTAQKNNQRKTVGNWQLAKESREGIYNAVISAKEREFLFTCHLVPCFHPLCRFEDKTRNLKKGNLL